MYGWGGKINILSSKCAKELYVKCQVEVISMCYSLVAVPLIREYLAKLSTWSSSFLPKGQVSLIRNPFVLRTYSLCTQIADVLTLLLYQQTVVVYYKKKRKRGSLRLRLGFRLMFSIWHLNCYLLTVYTVLYRPYNVIGGNK